MGERCEVESVKQRLNMCSSQDGGIMEKTTNLSLKQHSGSHFGAISAMLRVGGRGKGGTRTSKSLENKTVQLEHADHVRLLFGCIVLQPRS